jgi:hypothetical protein
MAIAPVLEAKAPSIVAVNCYLLIPFGSGDHGPNLWIPPSLHIGRECFRIGDQGVIFGVGLDPKKKRFWD